MPAPKAEVVDTVGAGDSFMGALLCWLDRAGRLGEGPRARLSGLGSTDVEEMLSFDASAAAHTVTREGADPPTAEELSAAMSTTGQAGRGGNAAPI